MKCLEDGCFKEHNARGYCRSHYQKHRDLGHFVAEDSSRSCDICHVRLLGPVQGRQNECRDCMALPDMGHSFWAPGELEKSVRRCKDAMNDGLTDEELMGRFGLKVFETANGK